MIRGHGQVRPKLDGQGQVHCSLTELWAAKTSRQCSSGYSHPGHSRSLLCVGAIQSRRRGQPRVLAWTRTFQGCPVTPGSLDFPDQIHSSQLGVRRCFGGVCPVITGIPVMSTGVFGDGCFFQFSGYISSARGAFGGCYHWLTSILHAPDACWPYPPYDPRKGQRYTLFLDGGLIKGWGSKDSWLLIVCHD